MLLVAVVGFPAGSAQAANQDVDIADEREWSTSDLPLPLGFTNGVVSGTDGGTRLAGTVWTDNNRKGHGVVWDNGLPRLLGQSNHDSTLLSDVNDLGIAIGRVDTGDGFGYPVRHKDGAYESLRPLERADKINRAGNIVGPGTTRGEVLVWRADQPGSPQVLTLPPGEPVGITTMDDAGMVVASTPRGNSYVWSAAGVRTTIQPAFPGGWVQARHINAGRIVGQAGTESGDRAAVEWDAAGQVLRRLPGGVNASRINSTTMILGTYKTANDGEQPAVWDYGYPVYVLHKPAGAASIRASVITDSAIVAGSYRPAGTNRDIPTRWIRA